MKENVLIRKAELNDARMISEFQLAMAMETEGLALDPETVLVGVGAVFNNPPKGFYLVGTIHNRVVASLMITPEWSDWRAKTVWWIQSLYVIPEYRRQGIYRSMYEFLQVEVSRHPEITGIRLYVDRSNVRAQEVYKAMGMDGEHYQLFEWME